MTIMNLSMNQSAMIKAYKDLNFKVSLAAELHKMVPCEMGRVEKRVQVYQMGDKAMVFHAHMNTLIGFSDTAKEAISELKAQGYMPSKEFYLSAGMTEETWKQWNQGEQGDQ